MVADHRGANSQVELRWGRGPIPGSLDFSASVWQGDVFVELMQSYGETASAGRPGTCLPLLYLPKHKTPSRVP